MLLNLEKKNPAFAPRADSIGKPFLSFSSFNKEYESY